MSDIIIKVTKDGSPLEGAEVRVPGIGVEDTDVNGVARFDLGQSLRGRGAIETLRGPRYAARTKKASGRVTDEPDYIYVHVLYDGGSAGAGIWFTPDVESVVEV